MSGNTTSQTPSRSVTLRRGRHTWTFASSTGDEPNLLYALADLAERDDADFGWFDAALVSHHMHAELAADVKAFASGKEQPKVITTKPAPRTPSSASNRDRS